MRTAVVALAVALLLFAGATIAQACMIDGIATMTLNGSMAGINRIPPTSSTASYWAQFLLGTASPKSILLLGESVARLKKVLAPGSFSRPFLWHFGDGTAGYGATVRHLYRMNGWFRINVSSWWPAKQVWLTFDSAELHIVPATSVRATSATSSGSSVPHDLLLALSSLVGLACLGLLARQRGLLRRFRSGPAVD